MKKELSPESLQRVMKQAADYMQEAMRGSRVARAKHGGALQVEEQDHLEEMARREQWLEEEEVRVRFMEAEREERRAEEERVRRAEEERVRSSIVAEQQAQQEKIDKLRTNLHEKIKEEGARRQRIAQEQQQEEEARQAKRKRQLQEEEMSQEQQKLQAEIDRVQREHDELERNEGEGGGGAKDCK